MSGTTSAVSSPSSAERARKERRTARLAMRLSLTIERLPIFMTGAAAILSDFAASVVHVVAVAFAAFSLRLSRKPAGPNFLYGYERITFFSAGFEGAMIILGAVWILGHH